MQFESERAASLVLSRAFLVYEGGGSVAITDHKFEDGEIRPGHPIASDALAQLLAGKHDGGVKKSGGFTWVNERLLAESAGWRLWWTAAQVKETFVAGKPYKAWFPSLLWMGSRAVNKLFMFSFAGSNRPTPDTVVYRPKFGPVNGLNHIHDNCEVCLGSMNPGQRTITDWEKGFYDTNFKTADGLPPTAYALQKTHKKIGKLDAAVASVASRFRSAD